MSVLQEINKKYQELFRRDRLKLITEWEAGKVEALEKIKITDFHLLKGDKVKPICGFKVIFDSGKGYYREKWGGTYLRIESFRFTVNEAIVVCQWFKEIGIEKLSDEYTQEKKTRKI